MSGLFSLESWSTVWTHRESFLLGLGNTLQTAVCALALAFIIGAALGLMSTSGSKLLRIIARIDCGLGAGELGLWPMLKDKPFRPPVRFFHQRTVQLGRTLYRKLKPFLSTLVEIIGMAQSLAGIRESAL